MHFSSVVTRFSEDVDHFAKRILCFFRPFGNADNSLIAVLPAFQLVFRDKDVVSQGTSFRKQERIVLADFQYADKGFVGVFQNLDYLRFQLMLFTFGTQGNFHLVIVHCMGRVAFRNENGFSSLFRDKRVLSIAFTYEGSGQNLSFVIDFIAPFFDFNQEVVFQHFFHYIDAEHFSWMGCKF